MGIERRSGRRATVVKTLQVNVLPEEVTESALLQASWRSARSTSIIINIDGGFAAAFTR